MRADDNWKETRILSEDLEFLLGIPKETIEDFLKILENLIIHKFVEQVQESNDFRDCDCAIELPYVGSLVISTDKHNHITTSFVPRTTFYKKIQTAYYRGESPLVDQCAKILGEEFSERFNQESDDINNE